MRLFTAIGWFFKILFKGQAAFAEAPTAVTAENTGEKPEFHGSGQPAIQMLSLLQKEGRLLDFLLEDVSSFSDADIGAAVRSIHKGCRKVLDDRLVLRRILEEPEGSTVSIPEGFDPSQIELQGNVAGDPPYEGAVIHGGWYVEEIKLPTVADGVDGNVAAPAQVEVR